MNDRRDNALVIGFLLLVAVAGILLLGLQQGDRECVDVYCPLPPCETEDVDNCYWDSDTQGNGEGRSFTVIDGEVTYK